MPESREEAARKAGWVQHPLVSKEATASRWAKPQLSLRVWATFDLVNLLAYVEWMADDGRLVHHTISTATWRSPEVTEQSVVEWGQRALAKWLGDQLQGILE